MDESTREGLIEAVKAFAEGRPRPLRLADFCRERGAGHDGVYRLFGSWPNLLEVAGVEVRGRRRWTLEEVVAEGRAVVEPGEEITLREFCRRTGLSKSAVYEVSESWPRLRERVGGTRARRKDRLTEGRLTERFKEVVARRGDVTLREFCEEAGWSEDRVRAVGVELRKLRLAAGLPATRRTGKRLHDVELQHEYIRLWLELDREPSARDMDRHGKYAWSTYTDRWTNKRGVREAMRKIPGKGKAAEG